MGQAKRRGSFEERKAQSVARREAERTARHEAYLKAEAARLEHYRKHPEQVVYPRRRAGARTSLIAASIAMAFLSAPIDRPQK